jgi:large subunit ribosomal protein L29
MKIKDIKSLSDDELVAKEKQIKKDLYDLNNQRQLGRIEKPANVRSFRRDIARILTVLTERKNNGNKK